MFDEQLNDKDLGEIANIKRRNLPFSAWRKVKPTEGGHLTRSQKINLFSPFFLFQNQKKEGLKEKRMFFLLSTGTSYRYAHTFRS